MQSPLTAAAREPKSTAVRTRVQSIDILRGAIIIIMALDHTREFLHSAALSFSPEDLSRTTAALFFTRWITHFCAPVFMLTAGLGAFLWAQRGGGTRELSRFLWTRGLWLVFLELTLVRLAMYFTFDYSFTIVTVLWALGGSMIALAALVHLPLRALATISCALILFHNLADGITAASFGEAAWVWNVLHQPGLLKLGGIAIAVAYPLIPWIGVMAAGYCLGPVFLWEPQRRQRVLLKLGIGLTAGFILVRAWNIYGDPLPWSAQSSALMTLCSFLKCMKYPPSLDFLLMTLGPAIAVLGLLDRVRLSNANPLLIFGRVPLLYFVIHLFVIHGLAVLLAFGRYGVAGLHLTTLPGMSMSGSMFPADYGFSLWAVYVAWIAVVAAMYPLCRWFAGVKQRRRDWWLRYL
ncbi:MAG: heparan-alpha-glucosaminide N-acetyltransferase domain-containing protein [Bryobacteraceae bacterium]